jgi:hypothetical protein
MPEPQTRSTQGSRVRLIAIIIGALLAAYLAWGGAAVLVILIVLLVLGGGYVQAAVLSLLLLATTASVIRSYRKSRRRGLARLGVLKRTALVVGLWGLGLTIVGTAALFLTGGG